MGFSEVETVLASGNVLFTGRTLKEATLEKKCEAALLEATGKHFMTVVRSVAALEKLVASDPYAGHRVPKNAKRVVSFLRAAPKPKPKLPVSKDGATIIAMHGHEAISAYVVNHAKGPVFMSLIEKTFGKEVTTRTWDTILKLIR